MYKPINRSFTQEYLQKQHEVMRWLFSKGLTIREIREFCLGNIDEERMEVVVTRKENEARFYSGLGQVYVDTWDREVRINAKGCDHEFYLFKARFKSTYLFTRERPKSWRKAIAAESLYSLSEVKRICSQAPLVSRSVLTYSPEFATIGLTKLNITKSKAKGQG